MSDSATLLHVEGGVATITLNRPKEKNSLGAALVNSLCDNMKACMENEEVRAVCVTNVGNTFCAGANLKTTAEPARYTLVDLFKLMRGASKPIVGKINGHCMGGGVGLAAACDISVISTDAKVGFTEVRIGVSPAIISVVCLPKLRRADAAELMLSGEKIPAKQAAAVGLLNYAVAPAQMDAKVDEIMNKLVRGGPGAMAATKSIIYQVPAMGVEEAFKWTAELSMKCFRSKEARAGIMAFRKRTDAPWVPQAKL